MNSTYPHLAVSGAAMDVIVPRRHGKRIVIAGAATSAVIASAVLLWQFMPRGLQVPAADVRMASVAPGVFLDDLVVRANAEPLHSVILDSVESGRVEEVLARDGAMVDKGQLLFRLSNAQRNLDLLARQSEHAQQLSNLSTLRLSQEASRSEQQRRLSDLEFALAQAQKKHARNLKLAQQGFISEVALEESSDLLTQQQRSAAEARASGNTEAQVRGAVLVQMEDTIKGLQVGLQLVGASVEALAVRAPRAGRLTGLRLQVGETVSTGQHIGRIDDPARFKLVANVDEFYLNRVAVGHHGSVRSGEQRYDIEVSTIYPQIKDGRFNVEMVFSGEQPRGLSPGQGLDAQVTLGEPAKALLLPNGPFINDSGGAWVYVVGKDGANAEKRTIRTGRRSNSQIEVLGGLAHGDRVIISSYAQYGNAIRLQLN